MPSPLDAKQSEDGDTVAVLVGSFDPPSMDHARAAEALLARPDIQHVWMTPLSGKNDSHVRNMSMILCADVMTATRQQVTCCTVGLDKGLSDPIEVVGMCRAKFPYLRFKLAMMAPQQRSGAIVVAFRNQKATMGEIIRLDSFLPVSEGLRQRIASGRDESRSVCDPVWRYLQKHRLYR